MIIPDEFVIVVPRVGPPFITEPGADLSEYIGNQFFRVNKLVALDNGRSLSGSVFWGREKSAGDEFHIMHLLNQRVSE
jgi:hypothetical protein